MIDGRTLSRVGDPVPGDVECPMSWEYIEAKFRDCAALAANKPKADAVLRAQALVRQLDQVTDATEILRELA